MTAATTTEADPDWGHLRRWLEEAYGSSDPSRVLAFERKALRRPGWRFFYGALNVPSHGGSYAVAIHGGRVLQGETGLAEFVRDHDVHGHPGAIPAEELAATAMFFLSRFGAGDAMLITDPKQERKSFPSRVGKLLHEPRLAAERDDLVLQFWYLQRMLIRVTLHIRPGNALECEEVNAISLLESKDRSSADE